MRLISGNKCRELFCSGLLVLSCAVALLAPTMVTAAPVGRTANGANAAAIQAAVDQFRADLGQNNGVGRSFTNGRREINWDAVPDARSAPFILPGNFFNVNSPRGAVFTSPCAGPNFRVSGNEGANPNATNPNGTPVRFGEIDPSYTDTFTTFSAQKLFTALSGNQAPCNILTVNFFVPGTNIPATVSGFGAIFTDVDVLGDARVLCFDRSGNLLPPGSLSAPPFNRGLSFVGVSYNEGERIAQCQIVSGNAALAPGNVDGVNGVDVVAMDDFIYGEPRAMEHQSADFDGDGTPDFSVYRPSAGQWFVFDSGSNTITATQFGLDGDIPVDGDFDNDQLSDIAVYRPSSGTWFILNSSNGQFSATNFGLAEDKPVPGDYDKDGKTDIAVWRPSSGDYFVLRSSDGQLQGFHWGLPGDIPIRGAAQ